MSDKLKSLGLTCGVVATAAALTYLGHYATGNDMGGYGPVVTGVVAVALKALYKFAVEKGVDVEEVQK